MLSISHLILMIWYLIWRVEVSVIVITSLKAFGTSREPASSCSFMPTAPVIRVLREKHGLSNRDRRGLILLLRNVAFWCWRLALLLYVRVFLIERGPHGILSTSLLCPLRSGPLIVVLKDTLLLWMLVRALLRCGIKGRTVVGAFLRWSLMSIWVWVEHPTALKRRNLSLRIILFL